MNHLGILASIAACCLISAGLVAGQAAPDKKAPEKINPPVVDKKPDPKKTDLKGEDKKDPKKTEDKKPDPKKIDDKKPDPKKVEDKKDPKKPEEKKLEKFDGKVPATKLSSAKLIPNLSPLTYRVSTSSPECQAFFDQGLAYYYGYVWMEAARSFETAAKHDPNCAMAWWGLSKACEKWSKAAHRPP